MIRLTRLNGESFTLNAMLIESIQAHPDTTITLISGKKMIVKNSEEEVIQLVEDFFKRVGVLGSILEVGDKGHG